MFLKAVLNKPKLLNTKYTVRLLVNHHQQSRNFQNVMNNFQNPSLLLLLNCGLHKLKTQKTSLFFFNSVERINNNGKFFSSSSSSSSNLFENDTSKVSKVAALPNEEVFVADNIKELKEIIKKYPQPKNIVNSYFQLVSLDLKDKSLQITPSFKSSIPTGKGTPLWNCSYHLKWPLKARITATGHTKQIASNLAASKTIEVLKLHNKITEEGRPIIYGREEIKEIKKTTRNTIKLDDNSIMNMKNIIDIYNKKLKLLIETVDYNNDNNGNTEETNNEQISEIPVAENNPFFLHADKYYSKEKVTLPISEYKESFINLLNSTNCLIIQGEPGCGKSSRIPQYVLESWIREESALDQKLCRIAVTQPRRIAAISLAERVCDERNENLGFLVGYQIRLKSIFNTKLGRILYCTTGILLRHLQSDPDLKKFSHVILDEAHERDVNTDLLLNLLKKALTRNDRLKLLIMSATIDTEEFSQYFNQAPIFHIKGFTYPVRKRFLDDLNELNLTKTASMCEQGIPQVIHEDVAKVINFIHQTKPEGAILVFLPGWEDIKKINELLQVNRAHVYLLHSKLKDSDQKLIFSHPPPGIRKIILATNIAETSITINDVVYVVDTGIHKDKIFDCMKGIDILDLAWISKANANQRAGRGGRCQAGEAFHLYFKETFDKMPDFTAPKILNTSLTKVILDLKVVSNNSSAECFMNDLITPPENVAVQKAVEELKELELLDDRENLTSLGKTLANFQLEPSLAKALFNGAIFKCTSPIVDIVTLYSSETEIFGSTSLTGKEALKRIKSQFSDTSDHLALMVLYEKWLEAYENSNSERFCMNTNIVPHKMIFVDRLKNIHLSYLENYLYKSMPLSNEFSDNDELIKAVLYSGTGTVLEHRNWDIVKNRLKNNVNVLVTRNNHKATISAESVNFKKSKFPSNFLVYINETRSNLRRTTIVRECSFIPSISVVLFNTNDLQIKMINNNNNNNNSESDENNEKNVVLNIKNTNLSFICNEEQAKIMIECKEAIRAAYKYLVYQLTCKGEDIPEFLYNWEKILQNLDTILVNNKI